MSVALRELYQEIIIDHNRNPRNHHELPDATAIANGLNPLCGDKLTVYLKIKDKIVVDLSFIGCGCAISQASASLMTEALHGKSVDDAHGLFKQFHKMLTNCHHDEINLKSLNKLAVLSGVNAYPARVKWATLGWHTLEAALNQDNKLTTTE